MVKTKLQQLWDNFRPIICPKRFYKYGMVGLSLYDDRSILEKLCDKIDLYFKSHTKGRIESLFKPFFDWSLGIHITCREDIKRIEKESGYEMVTVKDWEGESKRQKKIIEEDFERKIAKRVKEIFQEVNQGRRFTIESMEKRREICKREGITKLPDDGRI